MDKTVFHSRSREDTYDFARNMAKTAKAGDIVCLTGDLGSGKTVFAKGFAAGLGVVREVVSPTFTMLIEYPPDSGGNGNQGRAAGQLRNAAAGQRLPMYHFDVYRLGEALNGPASAGAGNNGGDAGADPVAAAAVTRFEDIGGDEYLFGDGVCLIEWAEMIRPAVPEGAVWVEIRKTEGDENEREIAVYANPDSSCLYVRGR